MQVYADFHVHVGWAGHQPIKITASRKMTLPGIIEAAQRKGLKLVAIADAGCQPVLKEIEAKVASGEWREQPRGGFITRGGILAIAGCELETEEGVHVLSLLPGVKELKAFSEFWWPLVTNPTISTQRVRARAVELMKRTQENQGLFGFAHAFTPHKGVYGCWLSRLSEGLGPEADKIDFLELGLSADSEMALGINECARYSFLSNSDAHSLATVAREYNLLEVKDLDFAEIKMAVAGVRGRRIEMNFGLPPALGKYHRTFCPKCGYTAFGDEPADRCLHCGYEQVILGVWDRIRLISDRVPATNTNYAYRVGLIMLPGIGQKTAEKLISFFGNELEVLETAKLEDIERVAGCRTAEIIDELRQGRYRIKPGGGGHYGQICWDNGGADDR